MVRSNRPNVRPPGSRAARWWSHADRRSDGGAATAVAKFGRHKLVSALATVFGRSAIVELLEPSGESSAAFEFDSERTFEGGDLVVDIGYIIRAGDVQGRYVVVHRRQTDGSLKLAADIVLPGA